MSASARRCRWAIRPALIVATILLVACGSPTAPACSGIDYSGTATVRGRVTYAGAPVAGDGVAIGSRVTVTTSDGTFSLDNITPGPQALSVGSVEGWSASGEVNVVGGDNLLSIPVVHGLNEGVLAGRALDSCTGRPLAGVTVSVAGRTAITGSDGLYALSGLCCGTLPSLSATRTGFTGHSTNLGRLYNSSRWLDIVMVKE